MALAARSSAEPRTACPVCGGSIHPIAGKCKHCKTDLVKLRKQQQAAAGTPTPARLPYGGAVAPRPATAPVVPVNGVAPVAAPVIIAPPVPAQDPYVVPLPPPRGAFARSWPIIVAVIAAAAIVVSVILLLTGGDKKPRPERALPPPAPDRMNTDPLVPSDPWQGASPGGSGLGSGLGSGMGSGNTYPAQPAPPSPPTGPSAPPAPPAAPQTGASAPPAEQFNGAMFEAVCQRFSACGTLDASAKQVCEDLAKAAQYSDTDTRDRVARGECTYDRDKAAACLNALGGIPCSTGQADLGSLSQTILGARECVDVLVCH